MVAPPHTYRFPYARTRGFRSSGQAVSPHRYIHPGKAQSIMKKLMPFVDMCICNEEDAEKVLGINSGMTNVSTGNLDEKGYENTARKICNLYGCKYVATTLRKSYSASLNGWSAMLYCEDLKKSFFSREYNIVIVDRVGGGDSFGAGLIYSLISKKNYQEAIEFATAASCLKQTIEGDYNRVSINDVYNLISGSGNGRVQR